MANDRKVLSVKFVAEGIEQVRKSVEDLDTSGAAAAKKLQDAFARIGIGPGLTARINAVRTAFASIGPQVSKVRTALVGFGSAAATMARRVTGLATAAAGAVTAIAGSLTLVAGRFASNAEQISNQASALGVSVDEYQRLTNAARDASVEQGRLDTILSKFTIGVEKAGDEAGEAAGETDKLRRKWRDLANSAGSTAERMRIDAEYRQKVADATKNAAKETGDFLKVTNSGVTGLREYAARLTKLSTTQEQLAQVSEDFGARGAAETLTFLRNLSFQFDDAARAAAGLIPPLTEAEIAIGVDLDTAIDNLSTNLLTLRDRLAAVFGPAITEVVKQLTLFIGQNEQAIVSFTRTLALEVIGVVFDIIQAFNGLDEDVDRKWIIAMRDGIYAIGTAVTSVVFGILIPAFNLLNQVITIVTSTINGLFGTNFSTQQVTAALLVLKLTGAFSLLNAGILLVGQSALLLYRVLLLIPGLSGSVLLGVTAAIGAGVLLSETLSYLTGQARALSYLMIFGPAGGASTVVFFFWEDFKKAGINAFETVKGYAVEARSFIEEQFANPQSFTNRMVDAWKQAFRDLFNAVKSVSAEIASSLRSKIGQAIDWLIDKVNQLGRALRNLRVSGSNVRGGSSSTYASKVSGYRDGGTVRGPGTSFSDSILAWLSNNEFVMTARAVRYWGSGFMEKINNLELPGFMNGGLVQAMTPAFTPSFAMASLPQTRQAAMRPVTIQIGNQLIEGAMAPASALAQLGKAAQMARLASGGRRPQWSR